MNKTKLLTVVIIVLVIINLVALSFFITNKPPHHFREGRGMPREIVIRKLHFNDEQIDSYEKIILLHRQKIRSLDDSIRKSKNELYHLLNEKSVIKHQKDSLFLKLANYQNQIEQTHFNHFLAFKSICRADQLSDFEHLTEELGKIFSPPKKER
jgi:hypothetical protein